MRPERLSSALSNKHSNITHLAKSRDALRLILVQVGMTFKRCDRIDQLCDLYEAIALIRELAEKPVVCHEVVCRYIFNTSEILVPMQVTPYTI